MLFLWFRQNKLYAVSYFDKSHIQNILFMGQNGHIYEVKPKVTRDREDQNSLSEAAQRARRAGFDV